MEYVNKTKKHLTAVITCIIFAIGLTFYNTDTYIYRTGLTLMGSTNWLNQLLIDTHRFITGLSGTLFFMLLIKQFYMPHSVKWLSTSLAFIGIYSMGIYGVHQDVFSIGRLTHFVEGPSLLITSIEVICFLNVSLFICWLLSNNKYTNKLFLGGR